MSDPWLTLIGIGEDGLEGLTPASRAALDRAEIVFGGPRHLELAQVGARGRAWPVPFTVAPVLAERGRPVAVLASGDPFWHGAGGSLIPQLAAGEWRSFAGVSTFALAANRLGWRLEDTLCLGLHAAPLARLRPVLGHNQRLILLLRDGAAVAEVAEFLQRHGFGASELWVLQALGGPKESILKFTAQEIGTQQFATPVALAVIARGIGLSRASGLEDTLFEHDGQITRRPVRALTLSALAPRPGDTLWDIGTGSGSVSIEFLLAAPGSRSIALEADPDRAARARRNAAGFGLSHRLAVIEARAPQGLDGLPRPNVVFVGGGASAALLQAVWAALPAGARLVMNAVTLETEALLYAAQASHGGTLMRIDLAEMGPLGTRRGWEPARPVVQWSVAK